MDRHTGEIEFQRSDDSDWTVGSPDFVVQEPVLAGGLEVAERGDKFPLHHFMTGYKN